MSHRTAKSVSAIFAGLIACAPLATTLHAAPAEADKCLSGPKGATPAGGHWYYRVDRATKRACWYVGDARAKPARAAPEASQPAASSASPPNDANTQSSIANARAELPLPPARVEPDTSIFTGPRPLETVAGAIGPANDRRASDAGAQRSLVASRWVELADAGSPAGSAPSADNAAGAVANSRTAPTSSASVPPAAALPLAVADASSIEKPVGSVQTLLIAILGALALAGLLASTIFRLSRRQRNERHRRRVDRRVNWDSVRTDRPSLSDEARTARSMPEPGLLPQGSLPREPRAARDADERIAQMLSRLPRSNAS